MPVVETLVGLATALIGAIIGAIPVAVAIIWNTFLSLLDTTLELVRKIGFPAYWTIITAILFLDIGSNLIGSVISFFSVIVFSFTFTTTILFAMSLFSGLIYFLWRSKEGLTYIGRPTR